MATRKVPSEESHLSVTRIIRKVALYTYLQDAEERLAAMRQQAKEQGWEVTAEYREKLNTIGPEFDRLLDADHNLEHDAVLLWNNPRGPRLMPNEHFDLPGYVEAHREWKAAQSKAVDEDDPLAIMRGTL